METSVQKQEVQKIIDGMQEEIVQTVSELVRIRSVNPGYPGVNYEDELGGETNANKYLSERYEQCGLTVDMWEEDQGRANLGRKRGQFTQILYRRIFMAKMYLHEIVGNGHVARSSHE